MGEVHRPLHRRALLGAGAALAINTAIPSPAQADQELSPTFYFNETGHNLSGSFLEYFRRNRNGALIGLPITEEITSPDGTTRQYFKNAVLAHGPLVEGAATTVKPMAVGRTMTPDRHTILHPRSEFKYEFYRKYGWETFFQNGLSDAATKFNDPYEDMTGQVRDFFIEVMGIPETIDAQGVTQYTDYFILTQHPSIYIDDLNLAKAYRQYKGYGREHYLRPFQRLLWPGEIEPLPIGEKIAELSGISCDPTEPLPKALVFTPTLMDKVKHIEVNISGQNITAYEGDTPVMSTLVSTGNPDYDTPIGNFKILKKELTRRYTSPFPWRANYIPLDDVPFNMLFSGDCFIHGAYWHDNFGYKHSLGCVNLNIDDAAFLYDWARLGTPVRVVK